MSFTKKWIRDDILSIDAYHVPNSDNFLKLDAMESPFVPNQDFQNEFTDLLSKVEINRYPDPKADEVVQSLRNLMEIDKSLEVLLGNGSDELIQILAMACDDGDSIMSFSPSFVMYEMIAKFARLNYIDSPLSDFDIDLEETINLIKIQNPKIIFIAYPNNPTGNLFTREKIETIIQSTNALVVLDEAYYAYAEDTFLNDISKYENLVILRTISKIGFAGVRLGLLIGPKEIVRELNKIRLPYNINSLTQAICKFLLNKKDYLQSQADLIVNERKVLIEGLKKYKNITVFPSQANFVLIKTLDSQELFNFLLDKRILIKNLSKMKGLDNFLRITIGSSNENLTILSAIDIFYS